MAVLRKALYFVVHDSGSRREVSYGYVCSTMHAGHLPRDSHNIKQLSCSMPRSAPQSSGDGISCVYFSKDSIDGRACGPMEPSVQRQRALLSPDRVITVSR